MTIKIKILALSIITVLLTAIGLTTLNVLNIDRLSRENIETTRQRIIEAKKLELKHYSNLAATAIHNLLDSPISHEELIEQLGTLRFGKEGYFFAYSDDGIVTAHKQTKLIGKNLWELKSTNGLPIIKELIAAAKRGGDYVAYDWPKQNKEGLFPKLSYAIWIPELKWMLGTGFYLDDIDETVAKMEKMQSQHITSMISSTLIVSGLLVLILIVLSLGLANTIVKPLQYITGRLEDIAHKDVDLTQRLKVTSNDELGVLASAFNLIVAKVHTLVIKTAATGCTVTESANDANANCTDVKVVVSQGADSAEPSRVIRDLRDNVCDIVSVVNIIRGIAEQTNLQALNAVIEAALAGERSKDFVVVADEICTLTRRTQDSTQEIKNIIECLQKNLEEAVVLLSSKKPDGKTVVHSVRASNSPVDIASAVSVAELNALLAEFKI